jgi:hypothetical protein
MRRCQTRFFHTVSAPVADFPNGDDIFYDGDGLGVAGVDLSFEGSAKATVPEGALLAFIKQGEGWFYLWQTEDYVQSGIDSFEIALISF